MPPPLPSSAASAILARCAALLNDPLDEWPGEPIGTVSEEACLAADVLNPLRLDMVLFAVSRPTPYPGIA
jgi:hypothetical protein